MSLSEDATDIVEKVVKSVNIIASMMERKQRIPIDFIQMHNKLVKKEHLIMDRIIIESYISETGIEEYNKTI